jgi:hypothetical protein
MCLFESLWIVPLCACRTWVGRLPISTLWWVGMTETRLPHELCAAYMRAQPEGIIKDTMRDPYEGIIHGAMRAQYVRLVTNPDLISCPSSSRPPPPAVLQAGVFQSVNRCNVYAIKTVQAYPNRTLQVGRGSDKALRQKSCGCHPGAITVASTSEIGTPVWSHHEFKSYNALQCIVWCPGEGGVELPSGH